MSIGISKRRRIIVGLLPALLVLLSAVIIGYKIEALGYNLEEVAPSESYLIETVIEFTGHGTPINIDLALPGNLPTQTIRDESFASKDMKYSVITEGGNRTAEWHADEIEGNHTIGFSATVITESRKFAIDSTLPTVQMLPSDINRYLLADSAIQSNNPEIARLAERLNLSDSQPILKNIRTIYNYVTDSMKYVQYSGTTDALTAYHLNEASCGGKSRLMVALARHLGIPARLVGGKIMKSGRSTATHIWVEMFVRNQWVPFCPTNHYFAEQPSHYMILYYGEKSALTHTKDINFKYYFNLKKRLVANTQMASHADAFNVWGIFKRAAISLNLLKIILILPFGVLVVVISRNIIGLQTFGTFMPALMAIGFRDTGLLSGLILFVAFLTVGALVRALLAKSYLLHTPMLAIILTSIITLLLITTAISVSYGIMAMASVALFPIVILTLTVERFSIIADEDGFSSAVVVSINTMIVISLSYAVVSQGLLQSAVVAFPELLLAVLAMYFYVGRYSGFRLMELIRFRELMMRLHR